jgi:hypothetical protein
MTVHDDIIKKAKAIAGENARLREDPVFQKVMRWFVYLGLLRSNEVGAKREKITLDDALQAGNVEPRILELLPAILVKCPELLAYEQNHVPVDLKKVLLDLKKGKEAAHFRGVPFKKYEPWLRAPALLLAKRRNYFRSLPRDNHRQTTSIGKLIRSRRLEQNLTQRELAKKHRLSLKVIRDLEQGKLTSSFGRVEQVLKSIGLAIVVS